MGLLDRSEFVSGAGKFFFYCDATRMAHAVSQNYTLSSVESFTIVQVGSGQQDSVWVVLGHSTMTANCQLVAAGGS